jgi:hypothetical protein
LKKRRTQRKKGGGLFSATLVENMNDPTLRKQYRATFDALVEGGSISAEAVNEIMKDTGYLCYMTVNKKLVFYTNTITGDDKYIDYNNDWIKAFAEKWELIKNDHQNLKEIKYSTFRRSKSLQYFVKITTDIRLRATGMSETQLQQDDDGKGDEELGREPEARVQAPKGEEALSRKKQEEIRLAQRLKQQDRLKKSTEDGHKEIERMRENTQQQELSTDTSTKDIITLITNGTIRVDTFNSLMVDAGVNYRCRFDSSTAKPFFYYLEGEKEIPVDNKEINTVVEQLNR